MGILDSRHYEIIGTAGLQYVQENTPALNTLINLGLRRSVPFGVRTIRHSVLSGLSKPTINLDPSSNTVIDRIVEKVFDMPIVSISEDWTISDLDIQSAQLGGIDLSLESAKSASARIYSELENMFFNGIPNLNVSGSKLYGAVTIPARNTYSIKKSWADEATDGLTIFKDCLSMIEILTDKKYTTNYVLFVSPNFHTGLTSKSRANTSNLISQDLLNTTKIIDILPSINIPNNSAVLVSMQPNVVEFVHTGEITHTESPELLKNTYRSWIMGGIHFKADFDNQTGIVHATFTT